MTETFHITLAQRNATLGDLAGNLEIARAAWAEGFAEGADLVVLPRLFATGWPAHDLIRHGGFQADAVAALESLARDLPEGPALAIGGPWVEGGRLHDALWIMQAGKVVHRQLRHAATGDAFAAGPPQGPVAIGDVRVGFLVGADADTPDMAESLEESGAELLVAVAADPYRRGGGDGRMNRMVARVIENRLPLVWLNLVGGQDEEVFDGGSFVLNPGAAMATMLPLFDVATAHVVFTREGDGTLRAAAGALAAQGDALEQDYRAMVTGLGDYLRKSGIERVLLGLSGGFDSALVALIAADALGPDRVRGVLLPSEYTSAASREDAAALAGALGIALDTLPIDGPRAAVEQALAPLFAGLAADVTEENIQARLRGLLLMALSNKTGAMLLTTGNKSEVAVGYATIYGDMAGGFNPLKDLYKSRAFEIARWRNAHHRPWMKAPSGEVMAPRIIDKPPSAELRPGQKDEDSLPPYAVLDAILERLIEGGQPVADCIAAGFDADTVQRVARLVDAAEWKRRQGAPGVRLTDAAFGTGRLWPMVNRWRDDGR
ncbi:MAG: NAD+ synthase [Rubellimicrobium sp.]|nr:NAD+ synthase [Rubellimicrobium sp.]